MILPRVAARPFAPDGGRPMDQSPTPRSASATAAASRGWAFQLAAVGLVVVSALAVTGLAAKAGREVARLARVPPIHDAPKETETAKPTDKFPARLFTGWPKPDLALVLTGQQVGYLLP